MPEVQGSESEQEVEPWRHAPSPICHDRVRSEVPGRVTAAPAHSAGGSSCRMRPPEADALPTISRRRALLSRDPFVGEDLCVSGGSVSADTDGDLGEDLRPPIPSPLTRRVVSVWVWPMVLIVVVAVAGEFLGAVGAAAAAAVVFGIALFVIGVWWLGPQQRAWVLIVALGIALVGTVGLVGTAVPFTRTGDAGRSELRGAKLSQRDIASWDLRGADLSGAELEGLDLRRESLAGAVVRGASLRGSRLEGVSLRGADLSGADLREACLRGADFAGAIVAGVQIEGAWPAPSGIDLNGAGAVGEPSAAPVSRCE